MQLSIQSIHHTALEVVLADDQLPQRLRGHLRRTFDSEGADQCLRIHWRNVPIEKRAMIENAMMMYTYTSERLKSFN